MQRLLLVLLAAVSLSGCAYFFPRPPAKLDTGDPQLAKRADYQIGPGDQVQVFVWRNPELTVLVPVRSDGKISVPLLQDVQAAGRTPKELSISIADKLSEYIQEPQVTVIVETSAGRSETNIRIIGEAMQPKVLPYHMGITLIDVMAEAGGLTEFADGNRAYLAREVNGKPKRYHLRIASLLKSGNMKANIELAPGDVIVIPERWY